MTPIVAIATFLNGWTVYYFEGRIRVFYHY